MGLIGLLLSNKMKAEISTAIREERLSFLPTGIISYTDRNRHKGQFTIPKLAQHLADKFAAGIEAANLRSGTSVRSSVTAQEIEAMLLKEQRRRNKA